MTERELLDLDAGEREALVGFERASQVFGELGAARPDDAARISAWVEHAVAQTGGIATAAAGTSKPWLVGGAIALVAAGGVAAGLLARGDELPVRAADPIEEVAPAAIPDELPPSEDPPAVTSTPAIVVDEAQPVVERPSTRARSDRPRPAPAKGAAELLRQAAAARRDGARGRALELYRRIGREFAGSREDKVARVAIGRLELDLGHPDRALAAFDGYLRDRSTGNLAEEAAFGRASALRALGRAGDEREALRDFIARFPESVHVDRARTRLAQLGG